MNNIRRFGRGENVFGVYTAPVSDSENAYIPKANRYVTDVATLASKTAVKPNTGHYNGAAKVTRVTESETTIEIEGRDFPVLIAAMVLGKVYNQATGMLYDDGSQREAPYCATSYHRVYESGVKFEQYLKGKWSIEGEESATSGDDIDPKNVKFVFTAIATEYQWDLAQSGGAVYNFDSDAFTALPDGSKRYQKVITKSVTSAEFLADKDSWYEVVQVPKPLSLPALSLVSSVPVASATSVAVDSDISLTLSNALSKVTLVLVDGSDTAIAGSLSWSADAKSITLKTTEDLAASTIHTLAYECIDTYGQTIQGAITFTTA